MPVALIVWTAGAAYCLGYESLTSGRADWPPSLLWSLYGVMPWLLLFEYVKRAEWGADAPVPLTILAALLIGTGMASLAAEYAVDWLMGGHSAPLALLVMRRLPAVGATLLLLLLARRHMTEATRRSENVEESDQIDFVRTHAARIRWIAAADNYLEFHIDGGIWTKRLTMRQATEALAPLGFCRIHRSYIVNRLFVAHVEGMGSNPVVILKDDKTLPIGKAFRANLGGLD